MDYSAPGIRTELYPDIEPHQSGYRRLDQRHEMYWDVSGNDDGVPAVFLHGGPGAGASPMHPRFFDPAHNPLRIFAPPAAGRARPTGEHPGNPTPHLSAALA